MSIREIWVGQRMVLVLVDFEGDALTVRWDEPVGPPPAIVTGEPREVRRHSAILPRWALTRDPIANTWPATLPAELPPALAAAVMATLEAERIVRQVKAMLDRELL